MARKGSENKLCGKLVLDNSKQTVNTTKVHNVSLFNFLNLFRVFLSRDVIIKKVFIFLSFFFLFAFPAVAACTITVSPSSIQANTDTTVTFTAIDTDMYINNVNYSFDNGIVNGGGTFSSFTQPSWALSCSNGGSSVGCYVNNIYSTFPLTAVVNIPSNQAVHVHMGDHSSDDCYTQLSVNNQPPTVNTISNATINEGDTYSANGSFTDADSSSWTATVDYGDGAGAQSLTLTGTNFSLSHVYKDNGTYTVTVSVTDNQGATGTGTATITVNNVTPTVGTITAPSSPVLVNTAITASASFTDPGVLDTHTASWNWGDGNTTTGTVTETNGSGSVSNNHTYTATGVYTITLTVTDKDSGVGTSTFQYVAVYDSTSSFAGGRSFDNPSSASPNTTGKVSFGISSKYNNSNVLTGSVKMNFKAASIDFASISLSSLATSNGKAYLKGSGTVNGSGSYTFLASGIDGSVVGGNDLIRFQIKDSSNNVVYDSQPGAGDTVDPTTSDATGNIRVH